MGHEERDQPTPRSTTDSCKPICSHVWFVSGYLLGMDTREIPSLTTGEIITRVANSMECLVPWDEEGAVTNGYEDGRRNDSRRLGLRLKNCSLAKPLIKSEAQQKETRTVKLDPMEAAETTKRIMASCCFTEKERNFEVVCSTQRRSISGKYHRKSRTITIYVRAGSHVMDPYCIGFHELAHHLMWERHGHLLESQFYQGRRMAVHGSEFKKILDELLGTFNFRYREFLKGTITYDRRRPRIAPRWEYFPGRPDKLGYFV